MGFNELATAVYLQTGFQNWSLLYNKLFQTPLVDNFNSRAAFTGGARFGQRFAGPASVKLY